MKKDLFEGHPLWGTLGDVEAKLTQVDELGDAIISSEIDEIRQVRAYSVAFSETDQLFLVRQQLLDELNSAWTQVSASLNNYIQNPAGHRGHLDNALEPHLDQVRAYIAQFPKADEAGAKKAASTRAASAYLEQLEVARGLLASQIDQLKTDREATLEQHRVELSALNTLVADLKAQISSLGNRIDSDETRISTALTQSNEAFNKAQTDRQERFGKWLEEQEDSFTEAAGPHLGSIIDADEKAEAALKEIESLRSSVVDMSNLATGDILGNDYKKSSRWDRVAGYIGYGVGVLAGVAGVLILIFAFGNVGDGLEWPQVAIKLGLTAGIGGVAAVAFRFGGQSLSRATAFKRQELELRALAPFLHGVDGSDEAKLDFVRQAFGRAWVSEQKGDQQQEQLSPSEVLKALPALIEAISKTPK